MNSDKEEAIQKGAEESYQHSSYHKPLGKTMWFQAFEAGYLQAEFEMQQTFINKELLLSFKIQKLEEQLEACNDKSGGIH